MFFGFNPENQYESEDRDFTISMPGHFCLLSKDCYIWLNHHYNLKGNILIVDDHQLVLDRLVSIVNDLEQFSVLAKAHNGEEAVEKAKSLQPDIVLMDILVNQPWKGSIASNII